MRPHALIVLLAIAGLYMGGVEAAEPNDPSAGGASTARVSVLTGEQVVQILDETVDWYRTLGTQQQNATQPSDLLILFANRQTADKVVGLAFDIARANAELLSSEAGAEQGGADASSPQSLTQHQNQLDALRQSIQQEIDAARHKLASSGTDKQNIEATLTELQGELAMANARKNLLDTMTEFVSTNDPKAAGANALKAQIDAIAATVPSSGVNATAAPSITALSPTTSPSLSSPADSAGSGTLKDLRNQFDTLAWLFKQTSEILIPLTKERVLLQQYQHNLGNWRDSAERQYHDALTALSVRLGIVAGILAVVFVLAEIWKRAVLRYAREPRRRYQLLLVRTIVLWTIVIAVVGLSFVSEISTFATFAGLITAGLAVAMQSVLVSVVGYFFLIGKYGIRVGDRIQIGTVVGEVIDLGLVRMHLMELNQQGPLGPTGRVVAFANLIVFQASGGLFKQIPGVNLSWHETTLTLPTVKDYAALKDRLLAAVGSVSSQYREEIARQ